MSGEEPSGDYRRRAKERSDEYAASIEAYLRLQGLLPGPGPDPDTPTHASRVHDCLAMTPDEVASLPREEVSKMALDVSNFCRLVQEFANKQAAKVVREKLAITRLIEGRLDEYRHVFKTEDRRLAAIADDPQAMAHYEIQQNCEALLRRVDSMADRLEAYARGLRDLHYARQ